MGEMADYYLNHVSPDYFIYSGHKISTYKPKKVTCRCCLNKNLHWGMFNNKWRLFDNHGVHRCPKNLLDKLHW